MACYCSIIPADVLKRLSEDTSLSPQDRKKFADTLLVDKQIRKLRTQAGKLASVTTSLAQIAVTIPSSPAITVADCHHGLTLPGSLVPNPGSSTDQTIKRTFTDTTAVAEFYKTVFGRNSIDNAGMPLNSSVHYGVKYYNAFWNGSRMTYGDGDGAIFIDFTKSDDVICHELTHGVTQYSLQLAYTNEAGGLNESISDVFGTMFRQWHANQTVNTADWLIGHDIMGPGALAKGFTCLRDMADPQATHCLSKQPVHYRDYAPGMDPHESSGIPNLAFYKIAMAAGGNSWSTVGQIWYKAVTGFTPSPNMKMKTFADRTRQLADSLYGKTLLKTFDAGWTSVGL